MATLVAVTLVPLTFFTRRRPEDMGLLPDGDTAREFATRGGGHPSNVVDHAWVAIDWTRARFRPRASGGWALAAPPAPSPGTAVREARRKHRTQIPSAPGGGSLA